MKRTSLTIVFLITLVIGGLRGQDIENISNARAIKASGFLNLGASYLEDNRPGLFQKPFGYFGTLGLNLSIYENFQIPITLTYSDQQTTFARPSFRTFGISPRYKWVTLHAGYRNFSISPLLMSGSMIKGYGVELNPGSFEFSVFRGDFNHEFNFGFNYDIISENEIDVYKRKILGGKIGYSKNDNYFRIGLMKIKDDIESGDRLALDTLSIYPQENFGLNASAGLNIMRRLSIEAELSGSAVNSDLEAESIDADETLEKLTKPFLVLNESTRIALAYNLSARFNISRTSVGFRYRHVDPGYETLGFIFLMQGTDDYTFFFNTILLQSKLIINGNIGFQYSNTTDYFAQNNARTIYNGSISWAITPSLNWTGTYNNYNSEGNLSITEVVDSLQITTNNTGLNNSVSYRFGSKSHKHSVTANLSSNSFELVRLGEVSSTNSTSNLSLSYAYRNKARGLTLGIGLKTNRFTGQELNEIERRGINLRVKKDIGKKFSVSLRPAYDLNTTNGTSDGHVFNIRLRSSYKVSLKSIFSLVANYRNRNTSITNPFSQVRVSTSFNTRF